MPYQYMQKSDIEKPKYVHNSSLLYYFFHLYYKLRLYLIYKYQEA